MKKFLKIVCCILLTFILLIISLILLREIINQYNYNYKYSIAMPEIYGSFNNYINEKNTIYKNVKVSGLENIINDEIASLGINETNCILDYQKCYENRVAINGLGGQISIFPYSNEYNIKYSDKNKIIFSNEIGNVIGEIDLNNKILIYTIKGTFFNEKEVRQVEIITDNKKIEKLEKQIIKKHLKRKWFKQ